MSDRQSSRIGETELNFELAKALDRRHPRWTVEAERTWVLADAAGKRPDIVIRPRSAQAEPVIVEVEFEPASTLDQDGLDRLGAALENQMGKVEQVVLVKAPKELRSSADLARDVSTTALGYALVRGQEADTAERFPAEGWIEGTVDDLAGFVERVSLNDRLLDAAASELEKGIRNVAAMLRAALLADTDTALPGIAGALHQEDNEQTTTMGVAIIANAFLFQVALEAKTLHSSDGARSVKVLTPDPSASRAVVELHWQEILEVNYYPIFHIAGTVLRHVPHRFAHMAIRPLSRLASNLASFGVTSTGDMAGQMFGKLITDKKFLATFYTLPESAALLAEIAVARMGTDWSDREAVEALRVADLACGTGALLTAAYHRILARVRRTGDDDEALHPAMMENALIGADIMPAAVHLTATLLSSVFPAKPFADTGIHLMPYGTDPEKPASGVQIGSLELMDQSYQQELLWGQDRQQICGHGTAESGTVIDHAAADLVIMNPPFTRPTNHEAGAEDVPVPSFAGFDTSIDEQSAMTSRLKTLNSGLTEPAGHGNAGLGSNFIDVAHAKVKLGGTIAFVLPFTVVQGTSWSAARGMLAAGYRDICVLSIATTGQNDRAFSADTGMAEALIIATRRHPDDKADAGQVLYVNLAERPHDPVEGVEIARTVNRIDPTKRNGTLEMGQARVGSFIRAGLDDGGCAGLIETDLAAFGLALSDGRLVLPQIGEIKQAPITRLGELGSRGPVHRDITGTNPGGAPRGPFDQARLGSGDDWRQATFPMLWAHDAKKETRLVVEPDSQGRVREGMDAKAKQIWATASRLHFNQDFTLSASPLAACFTPTRSIGGTAWPSFTCADEDERDEKALLLWANTTLGLISFWWTGTRSQRGRVRIPVSRLSDLSVLDPRQLTDEQLSTASDLFDRFKGMEFLPANEAYRDPTRWALDKAVFGDLLGVPNSQRDDSRAALDILRRQWCAEPSVHGGKPTNPQPGTDDR